MRARLAVAGAGWWASHVHIPGIVERADAELVAVSAHDPGHLAKVLERFPGPAGYADALAMIAEVRPDAVVVATPHTAHFAIAMRALDAGCHLLVEKPLTADAGEARALVARARALRRALIVPTSWNFQAFTAQARAWIQEGRLGTIRHISLHMASATYGLFAGVPPEATADHLVRPSASTWADPGHAGGFAWGQLPHGLGWLFRVVPLVPLEVSAATSLSPTGVDVTDAAWVRFAEGATGALSGSSYLPERSRRHMEVRIFGTAGALHFDFERPRLRLVAHDGEKTLLLTEADVEFARREPVHRLIDHVLGRPNDDVETDGESDLKAVEVIAALIESARSGERVAIRR